MSENARETRFRSELSRAQQLWQGSSALGKCAEAMKQDGDRALCADAEKNLARVAALPAGVTAGDALPVLGNAALALARLFDRARYLSLEELGRERLEGDAGVNAKPAPSARPALMPSAAPGASGAARFPFPRGREQRHLKLADSAAGTLALNVGRLERDLLRELGAYLEYGPLSVRQAAFERVEQLRAQHRDWPALHRLLREASVLETDPELKARLVASTAAAFGRQQPAQPAGSK